MSDHKPTDGTTPRPLYDEELSYQPTPGWKPPRPPKNEKPYESGRVYDEELNYPATPGWKAPTPPRHNPLAVPLSQLAANGSAAWKTLSFGGQPLLTRPVTLLSIKNDGWRLTKKTAAWGAVFTTLGVGAITADHFNGALSSRFYPFLERNELGSRMVETTPPATGPIDVERGYDQIAGWREILRKEGYVVTEQKPWRQHYLLPPLGPYEGHALPPLFDRPMQAGPTIMDARGQVISEHKSPAVIYNKFEDIPPVIIKALAYVEDRAVVDPEVSNTHNAAVNWPRFIKAIGETAGKKMGLREGSAGGSGFGVQTFKNEAYKDGRTRKGIEKIEQMHGVSIRMYDKGADTRENRHKFALEYVNMVPFGRFRGVNDGMAYWFGNDTFNQVLAKDQESAEAAKAFRQVMTLGIAVKEPSRVLLHADGFAESQARLDSYIPLWVRNGIITPQFAAKVKATKLEYKELGKNSAIKSFATTDKAAEALKLALTSRLRITGEDSQYKLNSYHMSAESSLYGDLNASTEQKFRNANDPAKAKEMGLTDGKYGLGNRDHYDVKYSITIKQIMPDGKALTRLSVHTFDGQFDPNRMGKVNTGSTNKAVMYATLAQFVLTDLYQEYAQKPEAELRAIQTHPKDNVTRYVLDYLTNPEVADKSLGAMLDAYSEKQYATSKACWFTGEGMNCPDNFEHKDYGGLPLRDVIARSNNLGSYRFTADIIENVKWHKLKIDPRIFDAEESDQAVLDKRRALVERFARYEGGVFQSRAFVAIAKNTDRSPDAIATYLANKTNRGAVPLAALLFSVNPDASFADMQKFLGKECKGGTCSLSDKKERELFELHAPRKMVPLAEMLASQTDLSPTAIMQVYRDLNPKAGYQDARQFVGRVNPKANPFADMHKEFEAAKPDASLEATNRLAQLVVRSAKPEAPDEARTWFSAEEQLAALYGRRHPGAEYADTKAFILKNCSECVKWADYKALHKTYGDGKAYDANANLYNYSLDDRQYLAKVHPMWLEMGRMMGKDKDLTLAQSLEQTKDLRVDIYRKWLIEPKKLTAGKVKAQIKAAGIIVEQDAWAEVNKFWATLGYKFKLKPTLANVIAAAHNTEDLSTFNSILLNGGRSVTPTSFLALHFAQGTDHEMHAHPATPSSIQILHPETAAHVIRVLRGGAETPQGTSRRLFGAFQRDDGTPYVVFGKTGTTADASTGDFRGAFWMGGIGGCFAVTIAAYGDSSYRFTSGVAAQMVKNLKPEIEEMFRRAPCDNDASREVPVKEVPGKVADAAQPETPTDVMATLLPQTAAAVVPPATPQRTWQELMSQPMRREELRTGAPYAPRPVAVSVGPH